MVRVPSIILDLELPGGFVFFLKKKQTKSLRTPASDRCWLDFTEKCIP
jgi:hypothetical protein